METSGEGLSCAGLPYSSAAFRVKTLSVFLSAKGFPAQQGDFPVRWDLRFGRVGERTPNTKHFLYPGAVLLPKTQALPGVDVQAVSSVSTSAPHRLPGWEGVGAELSTGSSLGQGHLIHPQR